MSHHTLHHGLKLPFDVRYGEMPLRNRGRPVRLRFDCLDPGAEAEANLGESLTVFCELAATGGLCGAGIEPGASSTRWVDCPPETRATLIAELQGCDLDDAALIVLCDLLLRDHARNHLVQLQMDNGRPPQRLLYLPDEANPYPGLASKLPFRFHDEEPEGGGLLIRVEFRRNVVDEDLLLIQRVVDTLCKAVLSGAFCLPPTAPDQNYLESESLVWFEDTVEWPIGKLRADPACLSCFVNALAAQARALPIKTVTLTQ